VNNTQKKNENGAKEMMKTNHPKRLTLLFLYKITAFSWFKREKTMKKSIFLIFGIIALSLMGFRATNQSIRKVRTVVIDAGHGGHDAGCKSVSGKYEKNVALDVALLVGEYLEKNFPDLKVIYTRKTDTFIALYQRANVANRANADVFISIHCNSGKSAKGTETFALGVHRYEENLEVAKRENGVILLEKDYQKHYDGFDPKEPETMIFLASQQQQFQSESLLLADFIQKQYIEHAKRGSRGVKQQGLAVLAGSNMPSVLTEIGFLTHPDEEKFLTSPEGKQYVAGSIYRAFKNFKQSIDSKK
jgi:N-acetylmuramoyl-L-alanine amidase